MRHSALLSAALLAIMSLLTACDNVSSMPAKGVKVGSPYTINGKRYHPSYDDDYDRTGIASWYGPGFHGKRTANGEKFDQYGLTAAHPTLPMPSIVRVTNLETGKSLMVRINDRGPFAENRIIDLSQQSAKELGIYGLARVRVQFLKEETQAFVESVERGRPIDMAALNKKGLQANQMAQQEQGGYVQQSMVEAAPLESISSSDVGAPSNTPPRDLSPPTRPSLIGDAWADDSKTLPEPPPAKPLAVARAAPKPEQKPPTGTQPVVLFHGEEEEEDPPPTVAFSPPQPPPPAATTAQPASGGVRIIAGSFRSEDNAYNLARKLKSVSATQVESVNVNGMDWWRVYVGPFASRQDASGALQQVQASGVPDARIQK